MFGETQEGSSGAAAANQRLLLPHDLSCDGGTDRKCVSLDRSWACRVSLVVCI